MQITDTKLHSWGPRPEPPAATGRTGEPRTATIAWQLDKNPRDGWIDEDDLPYDQLELLERARATAARQAARTEPVIAPRAEPAPPPAPPTQVVAAAPRADVPAHAVAGAPRIDLLA